MTALCFAQESMDTSVKSIVKRIALLQSDALLPILECVSNSIISLRQSGLPVEQRLIGIEIVRGEPKQGSLLPGDKPIKDAIITDNGIGFHEKNYESFKTAHSDLLEDYGCLGVGRFSVLAAFRRMKILSNFKVNGHWEYREFSFDEVNEVKSVSYDPRSEETTSRTVVEMRDLYNEVLITKTAISLEDIAKEIMKHFFIYYLSGNLPKISLREGDGEPLLVNDLFSDVSQANEREFRIGDELFSVYITRNPKTTNRKTHYYHYCADSRVVGRGKRLSTLDSIFSYALVNKYVESFLDVFVVGKYLNERKYPTRNGFRIPSTPDETSYRDEITFQDIGQKIATVLKEEYSEHVKETQAQNIQEWKGYIGKHPIFHIILKHEEILQTLPANTPDEQKAEHLFKILSRIRRANEERLDAFIKAESFNEIDIQNLGQEIYTKTELDKDSLADYMVRRKTVIDLFKKYLEKNRKDNKYRLEADIHNLIFPKGHDSEDTPYEAHNLWLLDERLVSFQFIASHKPIGSYTNIKSQKAGDIVLINNPIGLGDKSHGDLSCLVVFEFKRPGDVAGNKNGLRWDFSDLTDQYFAEFRLNRRRKQNEQGLSVNVTDTTPKFGYIILSEIPTELEEYNTKIKGWRRTPFGSFYKLSDGSNMHIEAMTYDVLINSVDQRHSPFFDRLFLDSAR
jgi:hypothetical protein